MVPGLGRGKVAHVDMTFPDIGPLFALVVFHPVFTFSKLDINMIECVYVRFYISLLNCKSLFASLF